MATSQLLLYDHPVSSYAQKVRIALREKQVVFEKQVPEGVGSGKHNPAFFAANPRQEVPALVDGENSIFESSIILDYLEDKFPQPALLKSKDPAVRAAERIIEQICDTQYEAVNWGYAEVLWFDRATGDLGAELKAQAEYQTRTLQAWLTERLGGKEYFSGDAFGRADIAVAPILNRSVHYGFGPEKGSPLQKWHEKIKERASVKQTFQEFEEAAGKMTAAKEAYQSGKAKREYRDHRLEWMIKSGGIDVVSAGIEDSNIRFSWPYPK